MKWVGPSGIPRTAAAGRDCACVGLADLLDGAVYAAAIGDIERRMTACWWRRFMTERPIRHRIIRQPARSDRPLPRAERPHLDGCAAMRPGATIAATDSVMVTRPMPFVR
jgi:hypothetical protein